MVLLTKVQHKKSSEVAYNESGLAGLTENGIWVPLDEPRPCVLIFRSDLEIKELQKKARMDNHYYYQLAEIQNIQNATSEIHALPYIIYNRREVY